MDDVMDDMKVLDAHEAYGKRKAEFDATASDDAPMPTVVSLDEDDAPMPTVVNLEGEDAKTEASPVDARARMHELANAYKQQIHQDVQRMAKEMGVSYEDLFAAVGGQTAGNTVKEGAAKVSQSDEPETKAEKEAEAKDPQAEAKEPEHKQASPPPTPVKRQEHTAPAAPRSQDSRHAEFSKQAAEAMAKGGAAGMSHPPETKANVSQRKVESAPTPAGPSHPPSRFHPLPNQAAAEALGVPKAERVKEYERTSQPPVPLTEMGEAVGGLGSDFVRGAKGIGGAASQFVDTLLHPYGRGGEEDRRLEAARKKAHGKGGGGEEGGSGSSESETDDSDQPVEDDSIVGKMGEKGFYNTPDGSLPFTYGLAGDRTPTKDFEDARLRWAKQRSNEARDYAQGKGYAPNIPVQLHNNEFMDIDDMQVQGVGRDSRYMIEPDKSLHNRAMQLITKKLPNGVERIQEGDYPKAMEQAKREMRQQFHKREYEDPFPKKKPEPPKKPDDDKVKRPKY